MGGRAVEGSGLENRQGRKPLVGSNPTPSAMGTSGNVHDCPKRPPNNPYSRPLPRKPRVLLPTRRHSRRAAQAVVDRYGGRPTSEGTASYALDSASPTQKAGGVCPIAPSPPRARTARTSPD